MPLPSFLERFRRGATGASPAAHAPSPSDVELLRTRARRRLIGMAVLVGAGVLALPWLFETQPRPLSQDVRIVQAPSATEVQAPGAGQAGRAASGRLTPGTGQAQVARITPPAEQVPAPTSLAEEPAPKPALEQPAERPARPQIQERPAPRLAEKESPKPADKPVAKAADKPTAGKTADNKTADKKPIDKKPADKKPADAKSDVRYVVQFGAFAEVNAAREARQKAERMGLKTYSQQVDTPQGKRFRVRLGPFADKAEADKALATLRKGGLNGNILTL